jgi:hypothetical protein
MRTRLNNHTYKGRSEFGREVAIRLLRIDHNQTWLAAQMKCSGAYVSSLLKGRRLASPDTVNQIVRALGLVDHEVTELHQAAARDRGYEV